MIIPINDTTTKYLKAPATAARFSATRTDGFLWPMVIDFLFSYTWQETLDTNGEIRKGEWVTYALSKVGDA